MFQDVIIKRNSRYSDMLKFLKISFILLFASLKVAAITAVSVEHKQGNLVKKFWVSAATHAHKGYYGEESLKESEETEEDSQDDVKPFWGFTSYPSLFTISTLVVPHNFVHPCTISLFLSCKQLCVLYRNFRL